MNGRYEIKGSNTLYKVWGIITFVFAGIYGVVWLIGLAALGIGGAIAGDAADAAYGLGMEDVLDNAQGYVILIILVAVLIAVIGLVIRILAGLYLVSPYVKSKGAMIAVAVFYFLMVLSNLVSAVVWGKAGSVLLTLYALFCMAWAAATGVFLILKQAEAVTGIYEAPRDYGGPDGQDFYKEGPRTQIGAEEFITYAGFEREAESGPRGSIEGLFGDYMGKRYTLKPGESCRIGRDAGCEIQLHHSKVSRIHCAVKFLPDGRFEVTDYSYNGTFYENRALTNGIAEIVEAGGMLVVGDADNVFSLNRY